jgi:hypothetical protein
MAPRKPAAPPNSTQVADESPDAVLRSRLNAASKERLVDLLARLALDSSELAARIEYLTNPANAEKTLQKRIAALRNGKSFVDYRAAHGVAEEIRGIAQDIQADILPVNPAAAQALAEKLIQLDQKIFNRADDSGGVIGQELRDACVLWLKCAAAVRAHAEPAADWVAAVYELYKDNDYGVREAALKEAHLLLTEPELRALAARFERSALDGIERGLDARDRISHVITPASAMGLVAEALRDPLLYERSIRIYSPKPNELQSEDIAKHYLECGDGLGALNWLREPWADRFEHSRLDLLDRTYELLGDVARQVEIRRTVYEGSPSVHSYQALSALLSDTDRAALRADARERAWSHEYVATAAQLLFALDEPELAERLIVERAAELDGRNYVMLTELVATSKMQGRLLAATVLLRALVDAILARAYAKAYGHAGRYLRELRALAEEIVDYRGHCSHVEYESSLRAKHGRKTSFWLHVSGER